MKARVIHDRDGTIFGLITFSPDGPPPSIGLEPGLMLTDVEVPNDAVDLSRVESEEQIAEALQKLRVEVKTTAELVKRSTDTRATNGT
jgi:hypothetical protein